MTKVALWLIAPILMAVLTLTKWSWLVTRWVVRVTWLACRATGVVVVGLSHRVAMAVYRQRDGNAVIPPPPPS